MREVLDRIFNHSLCSMQIVFIYAARNILAMLPELYNISAIMEVNRTTSSSLAMLSNNKYLNYLGEFAHSITLGLIYFKFYNVMREWERYFNANQLVFNFPLQRDPLFIHEQCIRVSDTRKWQFSFGTVIR